MPKRVTSVMLALLYLSVSLFYSSGHAHEHGSGLPEQCAACAWHFEGHADVAAAPTLAPVPFVVSQAGQPPKTSSVSVSFSVETDRGPPITS